MAGLPITRIGSFLPGPVPPHPDEQDVAQIVFELDALLYVFEVQNTGTVLSYIRFDDQHPLISLGYNRNPRGPLDPPQYIKFTAQVQLTDILLTFPLDHAFVRSLIARSRPNNWEFYLQVLRELPAHTGDTRIEPIILHYTAPSGRLHTIRMAYMIQTRDSKLQIRCPNALHAASFLDILLGIDIILAVEARINDTDPHATPRR